MDANIFTGLFIVDAIETGEKVWVSNKSDLGTDSSDDFVDSGAFIRSNFEVIDLATHKDVFTIICAAIKARSNLGVVETQAFEDGVDLLLPKAARFGVALESMEDRKEHTELYPPTVLLPVPFLELFIDADKRRLGGWIGLGICIRCIAVPDEVVLEGGYGGEDAHLCLTSTRGERQVVWEGTARMLVSATEDTPIATVVGLFLFRDKLD